MIADRNKKSLIIVESPTKANTIKKYLPSTCQVVASKGHVVDLNPNPDYKSAGIYGVDVAHDFRLDYVIVDGKKALLDDMRKMLSRSEQLILASDEDREGESIAWHLLNQLKPSVPVYRMVFHEITKKAILAAFDSCREIDINLVRAQEARRTVDRLQGYGISPLLSQKLGAKYSAGRVQSPALKMIVEREKLRRQYKKSDYYSVETVMESSGLSFPATLTSVGNSRVASSSSYDKDTGALKKSGYKVLDGIAAEEIRKAVDGQDAVVESVIHQDKTERPQMPFTTSTLQQDATRRLHKGAREIMMIAQRLYENGFITYMRTDSPNLSDECIRASRAGVVALYGKEYLSPAPRNYKAKTLGAQEAHEAIRPSGDYMRTPEETGLTGDELKLYTLIWQRTLSTQMRDAEKAVTTVTLRKDDYAFTASGTVITFKGFRILYEAASDGDDENAAKEGILPSLSAGDSVHIGKSEAKAHVTQPPARYNEATLVKTLENEEIGRPSTYATIISTLLDRHYVVRDGQALVPTFTGFFVNAFLEKAFSLYIGYDFTKTMEAGLDKIAEGKEDKSEYLSGFWFGADGMDGLEKDIAAAKSTTVPGEVKNLVLSDLDYSFMEGNDQVTYEIRTGKYGPYIASSIIDSVSGKAKMASIDEKKYFPGTFTDSDARNILFPEESTSVLFDRYELKSGRYGDYLVRLSDGKNVQWPKTKEKAENASEDFISLLFELPKTVASDQDGNDVVLKSGPYGFYAAYKERNIRVADPLSFSADSVINAGSDSLPVFTYKEKSAEVASGRYGFYLKYDGKNYPLPSSFRKDVSSLTESDVVSVLEGKAEEKAALRVFSVAGEEVQLLDGRFGPYLKRGSDNIALPAEYKKDIAGLTDEAVSAIVTSYVPKAKTAYRKKKVK